MKQLEIILKKIANIKTFIAKYNEERINYLSKKDD